jgi:hypothetical protein
LNTKRKFKAKVAAKGVAPKRLTLSKHLTTESSLPQHPLPYAAKNMYYDEKWMEKQERGNGACHNAKYWQDCQLGKWIADHYLKSTYFLLFSAEL